MPKCGKVTWITEKLANIPVTEPIISIREIECSHPTCTKLE